MNQENKVYGYGIDFYSIDKLTEDIEQRKQSGEKNLMGYAVYWKKNPEGSKYEYSRISLSVLPDGSISTAHAENE